MLIKLRQEMKSKTPKKIKHMYDQIRGHIKKQMQFKRDFHFITPKKRNYSVELLSVTTNIQAAGSPPLQRGLY